MFVSIKMDKKDYYMGKEGKTKSRINPVREFYKDRKLIKKLALNDFKRDMQALIWALYGLLFSLL